jgi:AraC-like DNA-binding protein
VPTVLAGWTSQIVDYADAEGLAPEGGKIDELLARAGIGREMLRDVDRRLPVSADEAVWEGISRLDGRPGLGLRVSERMMTARRLGVVGFLGRATGTLGEALDVGNRYAELIRESRFRALVPGKRTVSLYKDPASAGGQPWTPVLAEVGLANYVTLGRAWAGVDWVPVEVSFRHQVPADTSEYERFFGCPVRFSQPHNAIVFSREVLELPLATDEPELLAYLRDVADARLAALARPRTIADDVQRVVEEQMAAGTLAIENVARRLGRSSRALQRGLRAEGSSFRAVVDAVRHRRAMQLLARGTASQAELAEALGFSEPRAFRRAFQRWTGHSPSRALVPGEGPGALGPLFDA